MRIGIIGAGNISGIYCHNAGRFPGLELVAIADQVPEAATRVAERWRLDAVGVAELIEGEAVDVIVNLTPPGSHGAVTRACLEAGKHVYSEKPLTTDLDQAKALVDLAAAGGLRLGVAPDTFLGASGQVARRIIDDGAIGHVVSGVGFFMSRGMEGWHPNPAFFFKPGGGPVLDIGPYHITMLVHLLGPVDRVAALGQRAWQERTVNSDGPHHGEKIPVDVDTTVQGLLRFACGAQVMLGASWDIMAAHSLPHLELYGTSGSIRLPDPNFMGGNIEVAAVGGNWQTLDTSPEPFGAPNWPTDAPSHANDRILGLAEMVDAIRQDRPHRASGTLGLHVLEVMMGLLRSTVEGRFVHIECGVERPQPLGGRAAGSLLEPSPG